MKHLRGPDRPAVAADLRRRYEDGATIRDLTHHTGRSYGYAHRLLAEGGTTLRPSGRRST